MNYREKIRKSIECPQFGNTNYGEWGALRLDQRKYIKRLLDELDGADAYILQLYEENKQLKGKLEMAKNNQKQASDSCRQHRLANKNHIRRLERREKQILRLKEQLEASEKARKEAIEFINGTGEMAPYTKSIVMYEQEIEELLDFLDIDKGE